MNSKFEKFEKFGLIADEATRKILADTIYNQIQNINKESIGLSNDKTNNFSLAIDKIIDNSTLKELCSKDPELAEKVTQEILDFINKTKKLINKTQSPYEKEKEIKEDFEKSNKSEFKSKWEEVSKFLNNTYDKKDFDVDFYDNQFNKSLEEVGKNDKNKPSFESVKEHLIEKWDELLFKKQTKWELELIEAERKKFCDDLYKRIEELKKMQEILEPFTNELGRLWDMNKGSWHRVNFDILKKYADILKKDKAIQELAEMLGRMRQAEKEYEEELFTNTQIKPEWKAEHASKEELIGIQESDDLNSLLPSEAVLLADETLQTIFLKKFAEKKLQTFEFESKILSYIEEKFQDKRQKEKEEKKGPFIICVDTSGSMHGTPETVAKALCFAILKIAIRDNRKCYLISFSTEIETLNLTDLKNSLDKIISFLLMSFHGGTDATPAMKEALRMLTTQDYKKADVIVISDFIMPEFDQTTQDQIKLAKDNKTKFHSLVIGRSQNPAVLKDFDSNWFYDPDNPKSVLTLVKNINEL